MGAIKRMITCSFGSPQCLCQWCEKPCNDGLNCHDCEHHDEAKHNIYVCTGFTGTYPWGTHSDEVKRQVELLLNERGELARVDGYLE